LLVASSFYQRFLIRTKPRTRSVAERRS
jgi:hypothetical protein